MAMPKGIRDEEEGASDSDRYGASTAVAGVLFGLALIAFMFALADGFS